MAKIALLGEAWGEYEAKLKHPFVGPSGRELVRMLAQAGYFPDPKVWDEEAVRRFWLTQNVVSLHNVFNIRPEPTNDVTNLCGSKSDDIVRGLEPLAPGKYLLGRYAGELDRVTTELTDAAPNIIIALGSTAAWFLFGSGRISKVRGAIAGSRFGKVLATYHPSAVLRQWDLRPVTILDLAKARRESAFREIRRPAREAWIAPTLADLEEFYERYIADAKFLSVDIETYADTITCIGFAPSTNRCIVVPFSDPRRETYSYWGSMGDEARAWLWVRRVLQHSSAKVFQNGLYDLHFLWRRYGIAVANAGEDTMLLHHALQPESPKGLDFLGSVYTSEAGWKLMRRSVTTIKKEE
jgi:uracil-DNA glycosylase